jgi:hypothetical protein
MLKRKIHPKWYVFSLLFTITIASFTLLLKSFYYGSDYFSLLKLNFPDLISSLVMLTFAFMGEVVWVSYAIHQLSKIMKPFYASQIVVLIWALCWLPSILINTGVILDLSIWPTFLSMMGGAAGMCAVMNAKTKSGNCVLILQYMMNMSALLLPVSPSTGGITTYTTWAIIYFLTIIGFMYFINPNKTFNTVTEV